MQYRKTDHGYLIRLEKGEEIIATLTRVCQDNGIHAGYLHGLGAALWAELGYYDLDKQEYQFKKVDGLAEIVALNGNVALKDGQPFLHIHAVLADQNLQTFGGHLKEAATGGTCEVYISAFDFDIHRELDEATGLSLLNLE